MRQGPDGEKSVLPLVMFLNFGSEICDSAEHNECQNGMECTGETVQTSKAGQFSRLLHSTF